MTSSRAAPLSRALRSCRPARRRPSARSPGPKLGRWRALRGSGSPSQELAEALLNGRSRNSGRLRGTQEHSFSASIPCVSGNRPLRMTQALDTRGWPEPTFHCNTESQQQPSARSWQRRPGQLARATGTEQGVSGSSRCIVHALPCPRSKARKRLKCQGEQFIPVRKMEARQKRRRPAAAHARGRCCASSFPCSAL